MIFKMTSYQKWEHQNSTVKVAGIYERKIWLYNIQQQQQKFISGIMKSKNLFGSVLYNT